MPNMKPAQFIKFMSKIILFGASILIVYMMYKHTNDRLQEGKISIETPPDFFAYYTSGYVIKEFGMSGLYIKENQVAGQRNAYIKNNLQKDGEEWRGLLSFRGPPITALLFLPLSSLDYQLAYKVMLGMNLLAIFIFIITLYLEKIIKAKDLLWAFTLILFFTPAWENFFGGQISILLLLIITFSYLALKKNLYFMAGILLSLLSIKPNFLLLPLLVIGIYWKDANRKKLILGFGLSMIGILLVNVLLYGINFIPDYLHFLKVSESADYGHNMVLSHNISSIIYLVTKNQDLINRLNLIIAGTSLVGIFFHLAIKGKRINKKLAVMAAIMFTLLLNMHTMIVDVLAFILPVFVFSKFLREKGKNTQRFLFILISALATWLVNYELSAVATIIFFSFSFWIYKESFANSAEQKQKLEG